MVGQREETREPNVTCYDVTPISILVRVGGLPVFVCAAVLPPHVGTEAVEIWKQCGCIDSATVEFNRAWRGSGLVIRQLSR